MRPVAAEIVLTVTTTTVMAAFALVLGTALAQPLVQPGEWTRGDTHVCFESPLTATSESGVEGVAHLCIDREGVRPALQVHGLQTGEMYTAWLAYFDRPSTCFHTPCGFVDLKGEDPIGVLGRVDGAIAPPMRHLDLQTVFRDLKLSTGAQVSLLVLSQGATSEADGRAHARQMLTPRMFDLGAPMAGTLADPSRGQLHAQAILTVR